MRINRRISRSTRRLTNTVSTHIPRYDFRVSNTRPTEINVGGMVVSRLSFHGSVSDTRIYPGGRTALPEEQSTRRRRLAPGTPHEWIQRNLKKVQRHPGKWLAVSKQGIVATASNMDAVYRKAHQNGVGNPMVFKVPKLTRSPKVSSMRN